MGILGLTCLFYTGKILSMNFFPEKYDLYQSNVYLYIYSMFLYSLVFWFVFMCVCLILFFSYEEAVRKYNEYMGNESK